MAPRCTQLAAAAAVITALLVGLATSSAQAVAHPEMVVEDGHIKLRAAERKRVDIEADSVDMVRVNGMAILTRRDLEAERLHDAGLAGAMLGPDVTLSVSFESPPGTPDDAATDLIVSASWDGLTTDDRTPYAGLAAFALAEVASQELCGNGGGVLSVSFVDPDTRSTQVQSADVETGSGAGCVKAADAVDRLQGRLQMSLQARMLAVAESSALDARLKKTEATASQALTTANAAVAAAKENTALVREKLQAVIEDLAGDLDDIHNCHRQGLLYDEAADKCAPVVGQPLCGEVPPGLSLDTAGPVDGVGGACPSESRVPGSAVACALQCKPGYDQTGGDRYKCNAKGLWVPVTPDAGDLQCSPVNCGNPLRQAKALVPTDLARFAGGCKTAEAWTFGAEPCVLECATGYTAVDPESTLTCGTDGKWTSSLGKKRFLCPAIQCPVNIPAGDIPNLLRTPCGRNIIPGSICRGRCAEGFRGAPVARCGVDGTRAWTADAVCAPESLHGHFRESDPVQGCPNPERGLKGLMTKEISLEAEMVVWVTGKMQVKASGRSDLNLFVDGEKVDMGLVYTPVVAWREVAVRWVGTLGAGNHTISLDGVDGFGTAGTWGCEATGGDLQAFWINSQHASHLEVKQLEGACPRETGGVLISKFVDIPAGGAMVIVSGHIIRLGTGRADMWLSVDDVIEDRSLVLNTADTWEDARVHWVGKLAEGSHNLQLISGNGGWGCNRNELDDGWGDMNIMIVDTPGVFSVESFDDPSTACGQVNGASELMVKQITLEDEDSVVMIVGHILRYGEGENQLTLRINNKDVDNTRVWTPSGERQWADAHVTYVTDLPKGDHRISLFGDAAGNAAWGCRKEWGTIDVVVLGE